ncbi:hypothetical protein [Haemophilus influenzae]|uniref:hypothetical protein n=1 Tax=Haemophilus influenzae TaxID=727 RepID=UPI000DD2DBD6|nr:hypothetical protein [Haemophilus influenzae]
MILPFLTAQNLPHSKKKKKNQDAEEKNLAAKWRVLNQNNDLTPYIFHKKKRGNFKIHAFLFIEGLFSNNF